MERFSYHDVHRITWLSRRPNESGVKKECRRVYRGVSIRTRSESHYHIDKQLSGGATAAVP